MTTISAPLAYQDTPLPIGFDKTISQPFIVALMTDLLSPEPHESILEVGTGLGYQAAVLAELSGRVWSVEIVEELAGQAEANLRQLGCSDVAIRIADGSRGWREHAPYDRALLTAAAERLPPAILDQIKPGGRIVLPLGPDEAQRAHGGRQRGGWTDQCSGTDPGTVQPARDGRVRHSYPYPSAPQARSLAAPEDQSHAVRPLPRDGPRGLPHHASGEAAVSLRGRKTRCRRGTLAASNRDQLDAGRHSFGAFLPGRSIWMS
jgi:protein-L-isoaspartate(D-aspartate) O-methyltransferase